MQRLTKENIAHIVNGANSFKYFTKNIFSQSIVGWRDGQFIENVCDYLQNNVKTIRVSARGHFKSYSLYAWFMYKLMYEGQDNNLDIHYISYSQKQAEQHVKNIKQLIMDNPYFNSIQDIKKQAESVLKYTWNNKKFVSLTPHGIHETFRGLHCPVLFVDDPYPSADEFSLGEVYSVNEVFISVINNIPVKPSDEVHVVTTVQTTEDFVFNPRIEDLYKVEIAPAINEHDQILWPEVWTRETLDGKRALDPKAFNKEYMCVPTASEEAFFTRDVVTKNMVDPNLKIKNPFEEYKTTNDVIGAFDVGKKSHPAHVAIFEKKNGKLILIYHRFMDGWLYSTGKDFAESEPAMLDFMNLLIKNFKIDILYYDASRGEYDSLKDRDALPPEMKPIIFTKKSKIAMSASLQRLVANNRINIVNDRRLVDQICSVTNELDAPVSKDGHGDAFWTCAMAANGAADLLDIDANTTRFNSPRGGCPSIFNQDQKIPTWTIK